MKVSCSLSAKVDASGRQEILFKSQKKVGNRVLVMRAKSGVFVSAKYFCKGKIVDLSHKKVLNGEMQYHVEQAEALNNLLKDIDLEFQNADKEKLDGKWLAEVVGKYRFPERYEEKEAEERPSIYELSEIFLSKKQFSAPHQKCVRVVFRAVSRYEGFLRATDDKDFSFDYDTIDREIVEDFADFLRNEKELSEEQPRLFQKLINSYPECLQPGRKTIEGRGQNSIVNMMKRLKAFFSWLNETGKSSNKPFEGVSLGSEHFGTPYYISIDERNKIATTKMPLYLERQRDIFIFQCLIGCRVGDLVNFTADNINDGVLEYTPHKTKNDGTQTTVARVPLIAEAKALVRKYKGTDRKGRLFPFISTQKYNNAIKNVFTRAGITRKVEVRNSRTGETETRPINEIASSHLARRTFVGNLYFKVQDPALIGQMSGHVEGSKAFARYRKIETETLKDVVKLLK